MSMWLIWLIIAGFFCILEIATTGFLVFWIGVGAIFAMIVSFFVENVAVQIAVFVISSILLIFLTKPLVNKLFQTKTVATNSYRVIGQKAIVTEDVDPIQGKGKVKVNGEVWSAKTTNDEIIKKGTEVEVEDITGVKLVVKSNS